MCSADFPGRSTSETDPVLIFDLDGTLLTVNSFPYWVKAMLLGRLGRMALAERLTWQMRAAWILAGRKLFGQSHGVTKSRLQQLWAEALEHDPEREQAALENLLTRLRQRLRPNLKDVLRDVAKGRVDAVMATAAAEEYAHPLGRSLGFKHILCSGRGQPENKGEQKRDRVLAWLEEQGWRERKRIFFTDHEEDLPLMRKCQRTLWFGEESTAAPAPDGAECIPCRTLSGEEIMRLIARS